MFHFSIRDVLWLTVVVGLGCGQQTPRPVADPQYDAQVDEYNRRNKAADEMMAVQTDSVRRAQELLIKQESEAQRMERLLDKMEEQARRKDAILDAEEKQLGIKK